jgi:hypothetical protein
MGGQNLRNGDVIRQVTLSSTKSGLLPAHEFDGEAIFDATLGFSQL